MPAFNDDSLIEEIREQIKKCHDAGREFYDGQYMQAAELFHRAVELAQSINDVESIVKNREWQGSSLQVAGKLQQALAVIAPTLRDWDQLQAASGEDLYRTLLLYITIAQRLPTSLEAIEKVYMHTETFLQYTGHKGWRSGLLLVWALLYWYRDMLQEALRDAQESWTLWRGDEPRFTPEDHVRLLVEISLRLRDPALVRQYLVELEQLKPDYRITYEQEYNLLKSDFARLEGRLSEAVDWARKAISIQTDDYECFFFAPSALLRAFLARGECQRAREVVARLLAQRYSERGDIRYGIRLLWGDYYLAYARSRADMPPVDDEYATVFPVPSSISNQPEVRAILERAERAYNAALRIGREIDGKLECAWRQQEIADRLARVEAIRRSL